MLLTPSARLTVERIEGQTPFHRDDTDELAFRLSLSIAERLEAHGFSLAAAEHAADSPLADDRVKMLTNRADSLLDSLFAEVKPPTPARRSDKQKVAGVSKRVRMSKLGEPPTLGDDAVVVSRYFDAEGLFVVRVRGSVMTRARASKSSLGLALSDAGFVRRGPYDSAEDAPSALATTRARCTVEAALVDGATGELLWVHRESAEGDPRRAATLDSVLDAIIEKLPRVAGRRPGSAVEAAAAP